MVRTGYDLKKDAELKIAELKKENDIDHGVMVKDTQNKWLYSNLGIKRGYIITGINDMEINSIQDISKLKATYGDDITDNIKRLAYINTYKEKKEVIFR